MSNTFQILAMTLNGRDSAVNVTKNDTIKNIKKKLERSTGIPADEQRIVYQGKELKNNTTVGSHNLKLGSLIRTIHYKKRNSKNATRRNNRSNRRSTRRNR